MKYQTLKIGDITSKKTEMQFVGQKTWTKCTITGYTITSDIAELKFRKPITKKRLTKNQKEKLSAFVAHWEALNGSYFWTPPSSASGRRSYEKRQAMELKSIVVYGNKYCGTISVSCSCKNIYITKCLYCNDVQVKITAIKKLLK